MLTGHCHQSLNISPNKQFSPRHRKKRFSNAAQNRFYFLRVGHSFIITLFPIVHYCILRESSQDQLVLRAKAPVSPSPARSKGAKSFIILFVPASPLQVFTLGPDPVAPREGQLRLIDRAQEIISLQYRLRSYRCNTELEKKLKRCRTMLCFGRREGASATVTVCYV